MSWTLDNGSVSQTFAEWRIAGLRRERASQQAGLVTFRAPGRAYDAEDLFAIGARLVISRDEETWFHGIVTDITPSGSDTAEDQVFTLKDPWYFVEQWTYKNLWPNGGDNGHLLLNLSAAGALVSTRAQATLALEYVLARAVEAGISAPFQIGSILAGVELYPPIDEVRDMTCAEVVQRQVRWHPDAVQYFDHSTTPPTLHIKQRSELTATTLALALGAGKVREFSLKSLPDLQLPAVKITYEISSTENGRETIDYQHDVWPASATGRELGALNLTLDMRGPAISYVTAHIETEPFDAASGSAVTDATRRAWWLARLPAYQIGYDAGDITDLEISDVRANPEATLPNVLISGSIAPWMGFEQERTKVSCKTKYDRKQSGFTYAKTFEHEQSATVVLTDATTGDYVNVTGSTSGDPIPTNLAQLLYESRATLQYQGSLIIQEDEITGDHFARVINLSGGRVGWLTMNALVQSVTEDIDTGTTRLTLGPARQMGHQDLITLLKVSRPRFRQTSVATFQTNEQSGSSIDLGSGGATENSVSAPPIKKFSALATSATSASIVADAEAQSLTVSAPVPTSGVRPSSATTPARELHTGTVATATIDVTATTGGGIILATAALAATDVAKLRPTVVCYLAAGVQTQATIPVLRGKLPGET